jgi:FkbM family methyltransferase
MIAKIRRRWDRFRAAAAELGPRAAVGRLLPVGLRAGRGSDYWIRPRHAAHPVCVRGGTSDSEVLYQVFVEREYGCLDDLAGVRLVIDCGANVGYSSAYFLSQHTDCHVVAVEPDPANFAAMQRNLAAFGHRVTLVRAGVWSQTARLAMSQERYRDGQEWSRQVRLCGPGEEADLEGVDVGSLLAASGYERISVLKVDVEGAEAVIFAENYRPWLDKVDAIAIELHEDSMFGNGPAVFFAAIAGQGFEVSQSGELTICRRPGLLRTPPAT